LLHPEYNLIGFKSKLESPTAIGRIKDVQVPPQPLEFYTSIWRFDESVAGLPSLASLPTGTLGYADFLVLDLDSHSSLDTAYSDALLVCGNLDKIGAVYECYFSGGKGFHIVIPTSQFGYQPTADEGILRRMAEGIGAGISTLDLKIYNKTRIFRYPDTWNDKGGKYKILIRSTDVAFSPKYESLADILEAANENSWDNILEDYSDLPLNEALCKLYEFCKQPQPKAQVTFSGDSLFAPCVEGGRNEQAFSIAHRMFKKGFSKLDVEHALAGWNLRNPKPLSTGEVGKVVASAEKGRIELLDSNVDKQFHTIGTLLDSIPDEMRSGKKKFKTGYKFLDDYTLGGFEEEELIFIAARSGNFKTAFMTNILQKGSYLSQKPCLFFSMEMGKKTLRPRLIQTAEGLKKSEVLAKMAQGEAFDKTREAFKHLTIVHLSNLTDLIENFVKKHGEIGAIGIDYLGLFKGCNNDTTRTAQQAQALKTVVAKQAGCPVFCLAQAKQLYEGREGNIELTRNCVKDSDSVLDLGDYSIGMWKHWVTFADASEDNFLFGRFLKSRGLDSDNFRPNPYFALKWQKETMQLEDILYLDKVPFKFKQAREEQ
jgi:hypothetical protein